MKERHSNHETLMLERKELTRSALRQAEFADMLQKSKDWLDKQDPTKLQDEVRKLQRENAELAARLQSKKKRHSSTGGSYQQLPTPLPLPQQANELPVSMCMIFSAGICVITTFIDQYTQLQCTSLCLVAHAHK